MNPRTLAIGIAAYNAQSNILPLVQALLRQAEPAGFRLEKIIVHSDASTDNTVSSLSSLADDRLEIIGSAMRKGFVGSIRAILKHSQSEVVVLLNDDIKIEDNNFIEKLVQPFIKNGNLGLVSGNPQPLTPKTFIEQAAVSTFRVYEKLRLSVRDGRNQFTCDGKVLALSKDFYQKFLEIDEQVFMGNLDTFLYFYCLEQGLDYGHQKQAVCYFRMPTTFGDYFKWSIRNNQDFQSIKDRFAGLGEAEFETPGLLRFAVPEFIRHPFAVLFIAVARIYVGLVARLNPRFGGTWDLILSTKKNI